MDPCYNCVRRAVAFALALVVVASAATAAAQYMYLDANGDGVHTEADVFPSAGSATLDVWLVTDHNRDGSQATCAGDPSSPLTINSYTFILRATQGLVVWSNFQDRLLPLGYAAGGDSTTTEFWVGRAAAEILTPGRYRLASITVTPTFGSPSILLVSQAQTMGALAMTSFGCQCMGNDFDNTMKLGSDWFDTDGIPFAALGNGAPMLEPVPPITVAEGSVLERTLHATDPDGQPLTFGIEGPSYATVTTTNPGTGSATGLLRVAPGYTDAGAVEAIVFASDGTSQAGGLLHITVTDVNRAPVLQAPADMTVSEGKTAIQEIRATDADGTTPLSFSIASGPAFMTLSRPVGDMRGIAADLEMRPDYSDEGSYTGVIAASDGMASDTESFAITVINGNQPPIVPEYLPDVSVLPGILTAVDITATDPEGEPLTFSKFAISEPLLFMTVLTIDPGHGNGLGRVELRPTLADVGYHHGAVLVSDGSESSVTYFQIHVGDPTTVDAPPVLNPIADMVAVEGETVYQSIRASDPEGAHLSFTPVGFFPFMGLEPVAQVGPEASARIVMAPASGDHGAATVAVRVSDGPLTDEKSFRITVLEPHTGSTMLLMQREGSTPSNEWETLQFRGSEAQFTASVSGERIAIGCLPPQPPPDGTTWGPSVQLACLPLQRPLCISSPINNWTLLFSPPLGRQFTPGVYAARPTADSVNAGFQAQDGWCWTFKPAASTIVIRTIAHDASGQISSFWADVRHDPDASAGLFTARVRFEAQLPVWVEAPSRLEAHAGVPLEVPLRIGGYEAGLAEVTCPELPIGAVIDVLGDSLALFRWTPTWADKGLYQLRFIAQRSGSPPDTSLMTTCVDIPGEVTATLDASRLEAHVTNRGATADWFGNGAGLFYPRGSGTAVGKLAGLVLGGIVNGAVAIDEPIDCCDYHPGPIQSGMAVPFEPRFKNYTIRRNATADFDWLHWPVDLGAPVDPNGNPLLLGDQTIWSLYNDAPSLSEPAPYPRTTLGVEVRQSTWAVSTADATGDAAFQSYRIRNAGSSPIESLYVGLLLDPVTYNLSGDLAFPNRGIMAMDTTNAMAYAFGSQLSVPNAVGVMLLDPARPVAVQDRRWTSRQTMYPVLKGLNADGTPRHERDDPSLPVTTFAYTGDPLLRTGWLYSDYIFGTVQFLMSAGPFTLAPGEERTVSFALLAAAGIDPMDAVRRLRERATAMRSLPPPPANRAPIADAGGPYSGFAGTPLQFDGSASRDPDGDALVYTWRFGDGAIGNGVQPLHAYTAAGSYHVRLSVFDAHLGTEDSTTAQVAPVDSAAALLTASGPAVRLQSARPTIWVSLEPSTGTFAASDVDVASVTLERADGLAAPITAVPEKSSGTSDADHDGIAEIAVTFRTAAMRTMLADLPPGSNDVAFWIRGSLSGGGRFAAPLHLTIDAGKKGLSVSVAPNPLNPAASLTFRTAKPGPARVVLFDVAGRVVRVALDERSTPAGYHEVPIGRDDRGRDLPSGVYFYRVLTPEGSAAGKLVMMK